MTGFDSSRWRFKGFEHDAASFPVHIFRNPSGEVLFRISGYLDIFSKTSKDITHEKERFASAESGPNVFAFLSVKREKTVMLRSLRGFLDRVAAVRSARNSTLLITGISLATKPIGYLRSIMIAWLFGASASMDAYNMALGLVGFFVGSMATSLENAVLPTLISALHKDPERGRDLMGCINQTIVAFGCLVCLLLALRGRDVVAFFAPGFTGERLSWSVAMLWCLLPYTFSLALKTGLDTWTTATERYVLPSVIAAVTSLLGFAVFVAGAFLWGAISLPVSMSFWLVTNTIALYLSVRDMPLRFRRFPKELLSSVFFDFIPCAAILGVGALYVLVDRYFVSMLSVGAVTHLSYANLYFGIVLSFATSPLLIFLTKSVKSGEDAPNEAEKLHRLRSGASQAIDIAFAYFIPISVACAATAIPAIRLVWGYGAFSRRDVVLTGLCAAAYFLAGPLNLTCTVFYRLAQAQKKLYGVTALSVVSMGINAFLDWLFYIPFGAPGVAFATSLTWLAVSLMYSRWLLGDFRLGTSPVRVCIQTLVAVAWGGGIFFLANTASVVRGVLSLGACAIFVAMHLALLEKCGVYSTLPADWRPSVVFRFLLSKIRSSMPRFVPEKTSS